MDMNQLLFRHQLALMSASSGNHPVERNRHLDRARDYAQQIAKRRLALGSRITVTAQLRAGPEADSRGG